MGILKFYPIINLFLLNLIVLIKIKFIKRLLNYKFNKKYLNNNIKSK